MTEGTQAPQDTPQAPETSSGRSPLIRKVALGVATGVLLALVVRSCQRPQEPTAPVLPQVATGEPEAAPKPPTAEEARRLLVDQATVSRNVMAQETQEAFEAVEQTLVCARATQLLNDADYTERTSGMPVERTLTNQLRANHQELARVRAQQGSFSGRAESIALARALVQDGLALTKALRSEHSGTPLAPCAIQPDQAILWTERYLNQVELIQNTGQLSRIANRKPGEPSKDLTEGSISAGGQ